MIWENDKGGKFMRLTKLEKQSPEFDYLTLIIISMLAYVITTALHEFLGHGVACALLNGKVIELNAFYLDCEYGMISDCDIRLIAMAGPMVSFLTGLTSFFLINKIKKSSTVAIYFLWLLGTISLLTALGYFIFSGVSGIGDFGFTRDGALFRLTPEWLWRILITVFGIAGYGSVVTYSLHVFNSFLGGKNPNRRIRAKSLVLISYFSGCIMAILVGLLNPIGLFIIIFSSLASTAGGTSALLWMMRFLKHDKTKSKPLITIKRNYQWIGIGLFMIVIYAVVFGPSLYI